MPSTTAQQAKFMTACAKGWDAESCPPMEVARKFHESDKKEGKFICKDGCEHAAKKGATALDDAGVPVPPPLGPMARLKLIGELSKIKIDLATAGTGPLAAMKRLKLIARANEIRTALGTAVSPPVPDEPVLVPEEPAAELRPEIVSLRDVAAGKFDEEGLSSLFGRIQEAVNALNEASALEGDAEGAAQSAITHWAELEVRLNGDA